MSDARPKRWLRILAWLLTPLVVWAASFLGGWLGARAAAQEAGIASMVMGAVLGGSAALVGWLLLLWLTGRAQRET